MILKEAQKARENRHFMGQKNVLEDILKDYLDRTLSLRFDICKCERCESSMMAYLLSRFPPEFGDPESPNYKELERELIKKYLKEIFLEVARAIDEVNKNLPHPVEENREAALDNLLEKIKEDRGVDFSQYHRGILKRRIALRLVANRIKSYSAYLTKLKENPHEYEKLFGVLTINVSEFFRDSSVWEALKPVLHSLIDEKNRRHDDLKLWSAGCATGEEAYSLAITVKQVNTAGVPVKIYATDIDKDSLGQAKTGLYPPLKIKGLDKTLIEPYFVSDRLHYSIGEDIKGMVDFFYHDLTSFPYNFGDLDVILCRNVFIYFSKALQERILDQFYRALNVGGYLVIGKTETLVPGAKLVFREINMDERIYQKIQV